MATEINAGDKFSNLDIFPSEPTGQTKDLITGKMFNQYFQEVNFHGNRKEAIEFLSDISYDFPEENDLKVNFDKVTGIEEVQINYERADFKVKTLDLEEGTELISSILPEIYVAEVSDKKRSISSFYDGAYHIDTKENAVRKEDVEFLLNSAKEIPVEEDLESYYREMAKLSGDCKFNKCSHITEPNCKIKDALNCGKISKMRYDNYTKIYQELKAKRRH